MNLGCAQKLGPLTRGRRGLEDLMRIRINDPPLKDFDAPRYALERLKKHKESDDETGARQPARPAVADTGYRSFLKPYYVFLCSHI